MAYGVTQCGIPYRGELDLDKEEGEYILYIEILYISFILEEIWKKNWKRIEIFVKYFSYFSNYENFKQFDHLGYNLARVNRK